MSAETLSAVRGRRAATFRRRGRAARLVAGVLADGTVFYAPIGEVVIDDELVICHLCGRSLRSVTVHLRVHGWTPGTRKLRAAAFTSRLVFEPAVREGSVAGRERARDGRLTRDAAAAAKGRSFPEQRRRKALRALAAISPEVIAQANRERARRHLARVAAQIERSQGYPDIGALVLDQVAQGASLAGISRRAGLDKDWLSRHLGDIDPGAAAAARQRRPEQWDARWLPALRQLGFPDVASYLDQRHIVQHQTINAIAAEAGLSHHAVATALCRHGLTHTAHAAKRHAAQQRAAQVAAGLGFDSIVSYVTNRRAAGWTWRALSAESGQPPSWLRRHQTQPSPKARVSPRSDSR
jgi:lambda repressor-like predicted transcriptional regulator